MTTSRQKPQERQPESGSPAESAFPVYSKHSTEKANRAAHLYFAEGKSFQEAMLGAGYAKTVAKQGPKFMLRHSVGLRAAFERASKQHLSPEQLKTIAIHRLAQEIASPKRTDGVKPIEVLGKMKEYDWFVRNGETNLDILLDLDVSCLDFASAKSYLEK